MIDTKSIREYLLEAAVHGRLSDNSIEGNQMGLLQQIEREYSGLLEAKKTKAIVEPQMIREGLFELPRSWIWTSLGKLCVLLSRGKSPKYSDTKKYPVFAQKCNQPAGLALDRALFLDETTLNKWPDYFQLVDGDVLINSTGTGTMGRIGCFDSRCLNPNYPFMVPDSHVTVARLGKGIVPRFIYYALRSPSLQRIMEKQFRGSTNQKEFYIDSVASMPIPLPPTESQGKIVRLLDSANTVLDTIDALQAQYADNRTVLKAKLIDLAIQGKLTEQLPEDGTAEELYQQVQTEKTDIIITRKGRKEKNILPIDENTPFDIPKYWKWIRFGETGFFRKGPFGSSLTKSMFVPKSENTVKVYEQQHAIKKDHTLGTYYITKEYFDTSMKSFEILPGDIIVSCAGTIGETYIMPETIECGIINQALMRITVVPSIDKRFFLYYFDSQLKSRAKDGNGMAITNIPPFDVLKNLYFPLPPLAEQKRIVDRLDKLLAVCDEMR